MGSRARAAWDREEAVVALRDQGLSYDQVAARLGYRTRSGAFKAHRRALSRPAGATRPEPQPVRAPRTRNPTKEKRRRPTCVDCSAPIGHGKRCDRCRWRSRIGKRTGPRKEQLRAAHGAGPRERFEVKVDRSGGPDACHLWLGSLNMVTHGYGQISIDGRTVRAHRWIWEFERGPIPDGMTIDHLCGTKECVNTRHLEVVTHAENSRRGRARQLAA